MKRVTQQKLNSSSQVGYKKIISSLLFSMCAMQLATAQNYIQYVQPLAGTASATTISAIKHSEAGGTETNANTIPAVTLPFAMTQWTAQTRQTENKCVPPYFYKDSMLTGFRGSHWLSGSCTQDYGSFTIMPVVGRLKTSAKEYAVPFSHKDESTSPSYYKLTAGSVTTEITSTLRCGLLQFTMQKDDSLYILVTPNSDYAKGFVKGTTAGFYFDTVKKIVLRNCSVAWGDKKETYFSEPYKRINVGSLQLSGFTGVSAFPKKTK